MTEVIIYTRESCFICQKAKAFLAQHKIPFIEIRVDLEPQKVDEMAAKSHGQTTAPQILIGGRHIGGWEELRALDSSGELKRLLTEPESA